jgi:amino acid transporter
MMAILLPAYSYTGLDGPAHMAEETCNAGQSVPMAMIAGFFFMFFAGLAMIVSLLFSIQVTAPDHGSHFTNTALKYRFPVQSTVRQYQT